MTSARIVRIVSTVFVVAALASAAHGGTFQVLYTFHGYPARDGANPEAAPIMDSKGDLYGTTEAGGTSACGVVYKLHKSRSGIWKETILYSFKCGDDGYSPVGGLVFDKGGNFYGSTVFGGTGKCFFFGERIGCGVIFKLSPSSGGWAETVLYSFPAPPGSEFGGPYASLTFDGKNQLFGTTVLDGPCDDGTVFRLKLTNGIWKEHDLHTFCGGDGFAPAYGALVRDSAGNLYGTTMGGSGTAFELSPLRHDKWALNTLHQFTQNEGGVPEGGLRFDASGNLYGAELDGGPLDGGGCGAIFELSPAGGGKWNQSVPFDFVCDGPHGEGPWQSPVFDSGGNLFGTTQQGGSAEYCVNCGVIYELAPQGGGKWSESVVYSFGSQLNVTDGSDPIGGLTRGKDGNFYGTTLESGDPGCGGCGVVYEFTP
ncbi:MAG: choice-of-anchor tandem repeat GloVer-containing protein [Rhizomicrobium sp.]